MPPTSRHYTRLKKKVGDVSGGLAIFLSTAPSLFEPVIQRAASMPA